MTALFARLTGTAGQPATIAPISASLVAAAIWFASCSPTALPTATNLDFEQACAGSESGACAWDIAYQVRAEIGVVEHQNGGALQITAHDGVGFVVQEVRFARPPEDAILRFSASIRTDSVTGQGAGLNLGVYDADSLLLQNVDMGYGNFSSVTGTTRWHRYAVNAIVPSDAASVHLGLINYGSGRALFDSVGVAWQPLRGRKASPYATEYIDVAMAHIHKSSLQRDSVDLVVAREKALQIAGDATTPDDLYPAIRFLLASLRDHHSFLMTARERSLWAGEASDGPGSQQSNPELETVTFSTAARVGDVGHITVPGFHSNDRRNKVAFADTLHRQIRRLYDGGVAGWIIDLRDNDGGNMAPMLAGLEPLFSADTLGFLIDVDGNEEAWGRGDAFSETEGDDYVAVADPTFLPKHLPIAVLYGPRTGSSGEIVVLSFVGNAQTRSFGLPSMGLTTGNGEFELPDGAYMYMASTRMADRFRRVYQGPVEPDMVLDAESSSLDAAIDWLSESIYLNRSDVSRAGS